MPHQDDRSDPSVLRQRLSQTLREARDTVGLTQRQVSEDMDWSVSKLIRIETGRSVASTVDLRALAKLYRIDPQRTEALAEQARVARGESRWAPYRGVTSENFFTFLGYESSAAAIRTSAPLIMPGLLRTEDYTRAAFRVLEADQPDRLESWVDLTTQRQEVLDSQPATQLHFILDEAVLRRLVGGVTIMRQQLHQLLDFLEHPNVTIRVVPFSAGIHAKIRTTFSIVDLRDEDGAVLYVEGPFGVQVLRESRNGSPDSPTLPEIFLAEYWKLEQRLRQIDSAAVIRAAIRALG